MIPKKYHFYTFSFFMSLLMSGVMSFALLSIEHGNLIAAIIYWPKTWTISLMVAFPISLIIVPLTQKLVSRIVAAH